MFCGRLVRLIVLLPLLLVSTAMLCHAKHAKTTNTINHVNHVNFSNHSTTMDFVIIGAQKAGTTFLSANVLRPHPMFTLPSEELHFWTGCQHHMGACAHNWTQLRTEGISPLRRRIATTNRDPNCTMERWTSMLPPTNRSVLWGDKTPSYMSQPQVRAVWSTRPLYVCLLTRVSMRACNPLLHAVQFWCSSRIRCINWRPN